MYQYGHLRVLMHSIFLIPSTSYILPRSAHSLCHGLEVTITQGRSFGNKESYVQVPWGGTLHIIQMSTFFWWQVYLDFSIVRRKTWHSHVENRIISWSHSSLNIKHRSEWCRRLFAECFVSEAKSKALHMQSLYRVSVGLRDIFLFIPLLCCPLNFYGLSVDKI